MISNDEHDTELFEKHGELIEREKHISETLEQYRKNASVIINGSKEALIEHRINCDVLSTKLRKVQNDLEFTERLIAAGFQDGKVDMQRKKTLEDENDQ